MAPAARVAVGASLKFRLGIIMTHESFCWGTRRAQQLRAQTPRWESGAAGPGEASPSPANRGRGVTCQWVAGAPAGRGDSDSES